MTAPDGWHEAGCAGPEVDATGLRANTQVDDGRAQVHPCVATFLERYTSVPVSAVKVSGPEAGKAFVLRSLCEPGQAKAHADQAFAELRDGVKGRRALGVRLVSNGSTRLCVGRGRSRQQVTPDITGKSQREEAGRRRRLQAQRLCAQTQPTRCCEVACERGPEVPEFV